MKAYHLTACAKIAGVIEFLDNMLEQDKSQKILVFCHHKNLMDEVEAAVKKKLGHDATIRIDGSVDPKKRQDLVRRFQEHEPTRVAILSILAAGVGLNLTAASLVVFAEFHWTPAIMLQAEDRAHRIGQEKCVNIYYLFGEETLDEIIYPMV